MKIDAASKYRPFPPINLPNRTWPDAQITKPPLWCSVDLRDGNQALIEPMGPERKLRMFKALVAMGFKEIEIGFPAASQTDFDFCRQLIDENLIPGDVTIQVLTQARRPLIERTFEAIKGSRRAVVHLYNSTSTLQRRVVFGLEKDGIKAIATEGTQIVKDLVATVPDTEVVFQYSPESFTGTEIEYAVEVCDAVLDVWQPTATHRAIINLPATVEMASPNIYADQIEYYCRHTRWRAETIISLHPHNDRGTGVAAAELGIMAGADRVEGTLFGNGERTGNVDIVTLALNMFTQGVNPDLDLSDINELVRVAEYCNQLPVHPRHPYAGDLVFTAFSGSHQDAIKKGLEALKRSNSGEWEVPYLPIDPSDVGRSYEGIIRVNSQSGKGGIAYLLEADYGVTLPRRLQIEFSHVVQRVTDATGKELSAGNIWDVFNSEYIKAIDPVEFLSHTTVPDAHASEIRHLTATIRHKGAEATIKGSGNGPIDAYCSALQSLHGIEIDLLSYSEQATGRGQNTQAVAYIELKTADGTIWGVGADRNIVTAALKAVTSAVNRLLKA